MEQGKEIDKDLTMLQPEQEPSLTELLKNAKPLVDPEDPEPQGPTSYEQKTAEFLDSSSREGEVDELDKFQSIFEDTNTVRARNQSEGVKGIKAVGSGIYQGALIALEQLGYVADLDTYTNLFTEVEDLSGNWWTRAMKDAQEAGRESDAFKIYEDNDDQNSILGQIFKWSSLEGAISSSVGFGLTGLGAASVVSKLGSLGKVAQLGKFTDEILGVAGGSTKAFTGPLASSMMSNYFMGQMMATDTYNQSMKELDREIIDGNISKLEAQKIAAKNAQDVVGLNMALVATSYLKFGTIFKRKNKLNSLVANPSAKNQLKDLIIKGSPTAMTENVYQEMIQMEQIDDTKKEAGLETEYSGDFWDRMSQLATSERALHAGALGVAGGPIQFAIIQRPFMKEQIKAQREAYNNQQQSLPQRQFKKNSPEWHKALIENRLNTFKEFETASNKALAKNDIEAYELGSEMGIVEELTHSATWGTLAYNKQDIQNLLEMTPEQASELGYDADFKDTATKVLNLISKAETYQTAFVNKENKADLLYNRLMAEAVASNLALLQINKAKTEAQVAETLNSVLPNIGKLDEAYNIIRDPNRFEGLTEKQAIRKKLDEKTQDDTLATILASMDAYEDLQKFDSKIKKRLDLYKKLGEKYKDLYSEKGEAKYVKKVKENTDTVVDQIKTRKDSGIPFTSFDKVVDVSKATPEQVAERDARIKAWNEQEVKGKVDIIPERTFTSFDRTKAKGTYSTGDIVRSVDGRMFKVLGQNYAKAAKGALNSAMMPLLVEVDDKFKVIGEQFQLELHEFLRPEVLQAKQRYGSDSLYIDPKRPWGTYMETDSVLKPNNFRYIESMRERAARAEVISVRNMEYVSNWTEELIPTKFAEEYDISTLNDVLFDGDVMDVTLKGVDKGEGKYFIDVYHKGKKISRLDRNSNYLLNIPLREALEKGDVAGEVTSKYTSKSNFVKILGKNGYPIRHDLINFRKTNRQYLPNGKIVIAQAAGKNDRMDIGDIAVDENGKVYEDNIIMHKVGDKEVPLEIPYEAMAGKPGEVFMLLISPDGRLVPVATHTKSLIDLESSKGNETYMEDVVQDIEASMQDLFSEVISDEEAFEARVKEGITRDNNDSDATHAEKVKQAVSDAKWEFISGKENRARQEAKLNEEVFKHFRQLPFSKVSVANNSGEYIFAKIGVNGKERYATNPNYFKLEYTVNPESGKLTAVIVTADQTKLYHTPQGKPHVVRTYLDTNPLEFKMQLSKKQRKLSIPEMSSATTQAQAQDLIFNQGLTADISYSQPFAGTSLSIQLKGSDIAEQGAKAAEESRSRSSVKRSDVEYEDASQETVEEVLEYIEKVTALEENEDYATVVDIAENENVDELVEDFKDIVRRLGLKNERKLIKEMESFIYEELAEVHESRHNEVLSQLDQIESDVIDELAKALVFLDDIKDRIQNGEYKLKPIEVDKMLNLEGQKFRVGTPVFNIKHGKGVIKTAGTSKYSMVTDSGKKVFVYPANTYLQNSPMVQIHKLKSKLEKLDVTDPRYKITADELARLEFKNIKLTKVNIDGTTNQDGEVTEVVPVTDEDLVTTLKLYSAYEEGGVRLDVKDTKLHKAYEYLTSPRGSEFVAFAKNFSAITNVVREKSEAVIAHNKSEEGRNNLLSDTLTVEDVNALQDLIMEIDFYNEERLGHLETLAKSADKNGDINYSEILDSFREAMNTIKKGPSTKRTKVVYKTTEGGKKIVNNLILPNNSKITSTPDITFATLSNIRAMYLDMFELEIDLKANGIHGKPLNAPTKAKNTKSEPKPKVVIKTDDSSSKDSSKDSNDDSGEFNLFEVGAQTKKDSELPADNEYREFLIDDEVAIALDKWHKENPTEGLTLVTLAKNLGENILLQKYEEIQDNEVPFKKGTSENTSNTTESFEKEVAAIKKMLPHVPINVLESVGKMTEKFGVSSIGAFDKGAIFLAKNADKGTAFHEAFHAVAGIYLSKTDKDAILKERGKDVWDYAFEETLADEFADYQKSKPKTLGQKVLEFFKTLINWRTWFRSPDVTSKLFKDISKGKFKYDANIAALNNDLHDYSFQKKDFESRLTHRDVVTLRKLEKTGKIKIVC